MSEFDNNQFNQNDKDKEGQNEQSHPQQNGSQPQDFRRSTDFTNENQGYPYNSYNNRPNNGYYGSGQSNSGQNGYYGNRYSQSPNYVYNGNNTQQQGSQAPNGQYPYNSPYTAPQQPKESKHSKKGVAIFTSVIAVILVVSIILIVLSANGKLGNSADKEKIDGPTISANGSSSAALTYQDGALTAAGVYEKVKESSVGVLVYSSNVSTAASEGSGVIISEDDNGKYSYIITCAHVVSGGGTIVIQLYDETQYDATLIGYDSKTDIAVLRIEKTGLTVAEIGDSEAIIVGESVFAIGNPGGVDFAGSFTNGMVSAIARPINSQIGYEMTCIQHTAAINPGNSGGALVNSNGQVIGINSSKIASTEYEGMGFSVPSSTFIEVYNEIVKNGYVTNRPKLGITYTPASASQTYSMLVGVKGLPAGSLIIKSIDTDSTLVNTNVQVGDLITKVNGEQLDSANKLPELIENSNVGDTITLSICHFDNNYQATEFDVTVTLVEDKGTTAKAAVETTTQSYGYYNPFGSYGYGN